ERSAGDDREEIELPCGETGTRHSDGAPRDDGCERARHVGADYRERKNKDRRRSDRAEERAQDAEAETVENDRFDRSFKAKIVRSLPAHLNPPTGSEEDVGVGRGSWERRADAGG